MAIVKEELVTIGCDNCKTTYQDEDTGYGFWLQESDAWESANNDGWTYEVDKHYCPKCHHYDEDDQLVIKNKK